MPFDQKISPQILANYEKCPRYAVFQANKIALSESLMKKELIAEFYRLCFLTFHEMFCENLNQNTTTITKSRIDTMITYIIAREINYRIFQNSKFKLLKNEYGALIKSFEIGDKSLISEIKQFVQKYNDTAKPSDIYEKYYLGEPNIGLPIESGLLKGTSDIISEKDDKFIIWTSEYAEILPDNDPFSHHYLKAALDAYVYEEMTGKECTGLYITYNGQKTFRLPYQKKIAESCVKTTLIQLLETLKKGKNPEFHLIPQCTECIYRDHCNELNDADTTRTGNVQTVVDKEESVYNKEEEFYENDNTLITPIINKEEVSSENVQPILYKKADISSQSSVQESILDTNLYIESPPIGNNIPTKSKEFVNEIQTKDIISEEQETKVKEEKIPEKYIGKVIHNEKNPLILSLNEEDVLSGAIKEKCNKEIYPGQILIAEDWMSLEKTAAIVEIQNIKSFPKTFAGAFKKMDLFAIDIETKPFMYYERDGYSKYLYPANFQNHYFRLPVDRELTRILHLSEFGIPLGIVTYENFGYELPSSYLKYFFPFDEKEIGYKGIFIVGSPGKGKTNLLKIFVDGISNYVCPTDKTRPTLIILDIEGQFNEINKKTTKFEPRDQMLWESLGIKMCNDFENIKIQHKGGDGTHTLSLNNIDPELLSLLFPELPPKSALNLRRIIQEIFDRNPTLTYSQFGDLLKAKLDSVEQNPQIKKAILSAIENGPIDYFDQGKPNLTIDHLMKPGKVINIQVNHMINQLPVLLYILMLLNKRKIYEGDTHPVILMIDEIHLLFPKGGGENADQDYLTRITSNLIAIARRGRKKRLGLIFASQQPHDIIPEIIGVFQTKFIMGLESAASNWIKETVGREYVEMIKNLPIGVVRIQSNELHFGSLVPVLLPKAPNKHEREK